MGLISGILMGTIVGIALMAGWRHMMRYHSSKRIAKIVFAWTFSHCFKHNPEQFHWYKPWIYACLLILGFGILWWRIAIGIFTSLLMFAIAKYYMGAFGVEVVEAMALSQALEEVVTRGKGYARMIILQEPTKQVVLLKKFKSLFCCEKIM